MVDFSSSLEVTLRNGITVIEALKLASTSLKNLYLESIIEKVKERVKEGSTISSQLERYPIFPLMVVQMISIGEESGRLTVVLLVF